MKKFLIINTKLQLPLVPIFASEMQCCMFIVLDKALFSIKKYS